MSDLKIFRALADTYESIQDVRLRAENQVRAMEQGFDEHEDTRLVIVSSLTRLKENEKEIRYAMQKELRNIPVWREFMRHVQGIGATLGGKILSLGLDPTKNLASWNAFFALTPCYWAGVCKDGHQRFYAKEPFLCMWTVKRDSGETVVCGQPITSKEFIKRAPRRKRGWRGFWNPRARVLAFIIGMNLLKFGKFYREKYDHFKSRLQSLYPTERPVIIHLGAQRRMVQLFLAHTYQAMNELDGRQYRIPYQFEYLGHSPESFIYWQDVVKYDRG